MDVIKFSVKGYPQPKGSMKAFPHRWTRFPVVTSANPRMQAWSRLISLVASLHTPKEGLWDGPVELHLCFRLKKPKALPKKRRSWAIKKPDLDKLIRAVKDALKGVVYTDDSKVVSLHAWKDYGDIPGVDIEIINLLEYVKRSRG